MATIKQRPKLAHSKRAALKKAVKELKSKADKPLMQNESSFEIKKRPFFERFLEGQNRGDLKITKRPGPAGPQPRKYPQTFLK